MSEAIPPLGPDETEDRTLGGRVILRQPKVGYRAATDPVLLAAACPARPGQVVLDLGCGAGAAALCLLGRVPGTAAHGLELQPRYAALARTNAALNGAALTVHEGDLRRPPAALRAMAFDHVICNPPFYAAGRAMPSPDRGRDVAHREDTPMADWADAALRRLRPRGTLTVVHRAERLPDILAPLEGRAGDVTVLPLAAREGRAAKRVIVQARKGAKGDFMLLPPLVIHAGEAHLKDEERLTPGASAVLRDAAALLLHRDA
ncbi:tRNA1(Val) (adenine(37)-N6)-methyltransferase [Rhodovulum sp. DZ06]|uniref:tRNA1(Val) (adenine(37)-N6)-methyltransferase n=1 Tax=Rhodovulum sp. DZ06 TaxID=3425126 RepID=UPI003D34735B